MAARATLFLALLVVLPAGARADALLVPLDGTDKFSRPSDFGYKVEAFLVGKKATISLQLTEAAAKAMHSGSVQFTSKGRTLPTVPLKIHRIGGGKSGWIKIEFARKDVDGGHIILWSEPIEGQLLRANFGGFRLSVRELLKKAVKVEPDRGTAPIISSRQRVARPPTRHLDSAIASCHR